MSDGLFEEMFDRQEVMASAQEELKALYDQLDGEILDIDDI